MADNTVLLLGGLGLAGAGVYLYMKNKNSTPAPSPTDNSQPSNNRGYNIPDNLLQAMQSAFWAEGSDPNNAGRWIQAMQTIVPASANAWQYVFTNWASVYDVTGHGWPSNDQLKGWLLQGIQNSG